MFKTIKSTRTVHTGIETDVVSDMLWVQIAYLNGWFQNLGVMKSVYSLFKVFNFVQKIVCIKHKTWNIDPICKQVRFMRCVDKKSQEKNLAHNRLASLYRYLSKTGMYAISKFLQGIHREWRTLWRPQLLFFPWNSPFLRILNMTPPAIVMNVYNIVLFPFFFYFALKFRPLYGQDLFSWFSQILLRQVDIKHNFIIVINIHIAVYSW